MIVRAFKARRIADRIVESMDIRIEEEIPEFPNSPTAVGDSHRLFNADGLAIAAALCDALPGGTLDELTAELLRRKACSLVVPRGL